MTTPLKNPLEMSFEEALGELEQVVRQLETGQIPLEEAIKAYERGAQLKQRCDALLKKAKLKVDEIIQNDQGTLTTKTSALESIFQQDD